MKFLNAVMIAVVAARGGQPGQNNNQFLGPSTTLRPTTLRPTTLRPTTLRTTTVPPTTVRPSPSYEYDFTNVFQAHTFVTKTARELFDELSVNFKTARGKCFFKCTIF